MDGILTQTHPTHWSGTLRGFRVDVSWDERERHYWGWVIAPEGYIVRVLRGPTIADVARQGREIIEHPTLGAVVERPNVRGGDNLGRAFPSRRK